MKFRKWLRVLHFIGIHCWKYKSQGYCADRYRRCRICGKSQMYDDIDGEYSKF